jgi:hypothetical protein
MQVIPTKFTFVKTSQERILGNLPDFSGRFKPLLKFNKDSNVESVPRFLLQFCSELDVSTIEKIVHIAPI